MAHGVYVQQQTYMMLSISSAYLSSDKLIKYSKLFTHPGTHTRTHKHIFVYYYCCIISTSKIYFDLETISIVGLLLIHV